MATHEFPQWEYQPRKLSSEEVKNPERVIHQFFDFANLPEARAQLWSWLKCTVAGDFNSLSLQERGDLLYFFEQFEKLLEASHILHQQSKQN